MHSKGVAWMAMKVISNGSNTAIYLCATDVFDLELSLQVTHTMLSNHVTQSGTQSND